LIGRLISFNPRGSSSNTQRSNDSTRQKCCWIQTKNQQSPTQQVEQERINGRAKWWKFPSKRSRRPPYKAVTCLILISTFLAFWACITW